VSELFPHFLVPFGYVNKQSVTVYGGVLLTDFCFSTENSLSGSFVYPGKIKLFDSVVPRRSLSACFAPVTIATVTVKPLVTQQN
jgi:hypothetical protein